jgi:hypothetical protein
MSSAFQPGLEIDPIERWRNFYHQRHSANPAAHPITFLEPLFENAGKGTIRPGAGPFDFERFQGFCLFWQSLTFDESPQKESQLRRRPTADQSPHAAVQGTSKA